MNECKPSTSIVGPKTVMVKKTLTAEQMLDKMYADSQRSYYAIRRNPAGGAPQPQIRPKPARTVKPPLRGYNIQMGESTALYQIFQACKDCGYKFPHIDGFLYHVTEEHSLSADEIRALLVSAPFFRRSNKLGIRKLTSALNVAKEDRDLILKILLGEEIPTDEDQFTESEEEYFKNDVNHIPDMALEPYLFKYSGVNNASITAKPQMVRVRTVARIGGPVRPNLKPMLMTKNIRPLTAPSGPVVSKAPYGVSRAGMGRKAYFTTASGEIRPVITVARAVPGYIPRLPPIESSNEFLKQKAAPHPCECKSEMRVVVDRTFSLEQKSIELMNELREMLAMPPPKKIRHRLNLMEDVPGKVVLPKVTRPQQPVEQPVEKESPKKVVEEVILSSSESDSNNDEPAAGGVDDLHEMDDLSVHLSDEEDEEKEEELEEPEQEDPGCARARIIKRKTRRPKAVANDSDDEEMIITDDDAESVEEQGSPDVITLSDSSDHEKMDDNGTDSHEELEAEEVCLDDMKVEETEEPNLPIDPEQNVSIPEEEIKEPVESVSTTSNPAENNESESPEKKEEDTSPAEETPRPFALPSMSTFTRKVASPVKPKSPVKMPVSPPKFVMPAARRVISPTKAAAPVESAPDPEVLEALKQAAWLRNGEPKTVFGENGAREVHHPIEGRTLTIEELLLCVCRLILSVKDRNITTIGFGVSTGDHEWMNTVQDNLITLALHHLVDAGLMTSGNMVFSKLRRSQVVNFKKSELALAKYGLKANEYFV